MAQSEGISDLTDKEVRTLLLQKLESDEQAAAKATPAFNPAIAMFRLQRTAGKLQNELSAILGAYDELPGVFAEAIHRFGEAGKGQSTGWFFLGFIISIAAGFAVEMLVKIKGRSAIVGVTDARPESLFGKLSTLSIAAMWEAIGIAVFAATASTLYLIAFEADAQHRITFFFYLAATIIFRIALMASRFFFSPKRPHLRISTFDDPTAQAFHTSAATTVAFGSFGFFSCALIGTLGIHGHGHNLLLLMIGTLTTAGLMTTVLQGRSAITADLMADRLAPSKTSAFAALWPLILAGLILLIWISLVIIELSTGPVPYGGRLLTIALLIIVPLLDAAMSREANRLSDVAEGEQAAILRAARLIIAFGTLIVIAGAWRLDPLGMAQEEGSLASAVWQVGITLIVTFVLWQTLRIAIDRRIRIEDDIAAAESKHEEMEIGGTGLPRIRTLLPLFKRTSQIIIGTISTMIVLAALGVDIAPVLAGAGVIGIAIGFGSQTLVRDIVSGVFFLFDDAFRLGEYIDVGEVKGSVEKMSIRSLQLRHHRGMVHTVPFGEIKTLTNYSRDWVIMKLKFRVPFDTDVEKVRKLFKKAGQQLLEDPDVGEDFLQPFKSQA